MDTKHRGAFSYLKHQVDAENFKRKRTSPLRQRLETQGETGQEAINNLLEDWQQRKSRGIRNQQESGINRNQESRTGKLVKTSQNPQLLNQNHQNPGKFVTSLPRHCKRLFSVLLPLSSPSPSSPAETSTRANRESPGTCPNLTRAELSPRRWAGIDLFTSCGDGPQTKKQNMCATKMVFPKSCKVQELRK